MLSLCQKYVKTDAKVGWHGYENMRNSFPYDKYYTLFYIETYYICQ